MADFACKFKCADIRPHTDDDFRNYVLWAMHPEYPCGVPQKPGVPSIENVDSFIEQYLFAHTISSVAYQNAVMDQLWDIYQDRTVRLPRLDLIQRAFEFHHFETLLQKLLLEAVMVRSGAFPTPPEIMVRAKQAEQGTLALRLRILDTSAMGPFDEWLVRLSLWRPRLNSCVVHIHTFGESCRNILLPPTPILVSQESEPALESTDWNFFPPTPIPVSQESEPALGSTDWNFFDIE